jgi:preprotein translocase subunit SecE
MRNKRQRIISTVIVIAIVLAMVIPTILAVFI